MPEGYFDTKDLAKRWGVTTQSVQRLASRGTLAAEWLSGKRIFRQSVVIAFENDEKARKRSRRRYRHPLPGLDRKEAA